MSKLFNTFILFVIALFLAVLLFLTLKNGFSNPFKVKSTETIHNLVLEKTKALGKLETVTFYFKDIVEQKLSRDYLPDPKALIIVYGEATGCLDLTKIKSEDIVTERDTIYITLPQAELCSYKIDHSKTYIYDASYAFMNEKLLFEEAYKSAEKQIKESALKANILNQASENAVQVLKPLLESVGQKPVVFK